MTVQSDQEELRAVREASIDAIERIAKQIQEEPSKVVLVMDTTLRSVLMHVALKAREAAAKAKKATKARANFEAHDLPLLWMAWRLHEVETRVRAVSTMISRRCARTGEDAPSDEWQRKVVAAQIGGMKSGPSAHMAAFFAGASGAPLIAPVSVSLASALLSFLEEKHLVKALSAPGALAARVVFLIGNVARIETIVPGVVDGRSGAERPPGSRSPRDVISAG